MKKFYAFFLALAATAAINAQNTYSLIGHSLIGWSLENSEAFVETATPGTYELTVADLFGECKISVDRGWEPMFGAVNSGDSIMVGDTYTLNYRAVGEPDVPNLKIGKPGFGYKNAVLRLVIIAPDSATLTFVSGTEYDRTALPDTYQIVGGFTNNWSTADAVQFEEVNGVLTATVENLNGSFKIIKNRGWDEQWATNWDTNAGLEMNVPYVLGAKTTSDPANLTLSNPFATYDNAVLTLVPQDNGDMVLTLVSGTFKKMEANWYLPGTKLGWNCSEAQQFAPVEGKTDTYEILAAEFSGDFKVVYGNWAVEFGTSMNGETPNLWNVNEEYTCQIKGSNINPAVADAVYTDCTITLVVDYENVSVKLLIATEGSALEDTQVTEKAIKVIENGQLIIIKNGVRYNALGAVL